MKKIRKALCILLAAMMVVCLCPITTMAEESAVVASGYCGAEGDGDNLKWTLTSDGTLTISGTGAMADYDWSNNMAPWLSNKENITSLVLEDGITKIGASAFNDCINIKGNLVLPGTVKEIGRLAFSGCEGLTGDLNIPEGVITVGFNAFFGCGFDGSLVIPSTVEYGDSPFSFCTKLKKIVVSEDSNSYVTDGEFLYNKDNTEIVTGISKPEGDLIIPEGVVSIGPNAFGFKEYNGKLVLPSTIKRIDFQAFLDCSGLVGNLVLPEGLETIETYAFGGAGFSGNVIIPETVKYIGSGIITWTTIDKILFKGDAPEVESDSFPEGKILYYVEGKSGWTSPTWNGYTTATWDPESGETEEPDIIASGYCGADGNEKNVEWGVYSTGVLTIRGEGKMKDYGSEEAPWYEYKDIIDCVEVYWITNIGKNTINFLSDSTEIHIYPAFYNSYSEKMEIFKKSITVQEIKELAGKFVEIRNVGFCTNANGEPRLWLDLIIEKVNSNQQEIFLYNTLSYSTDEKNIKISIDGNVRILSNYSLRIRTFAFGSSFEFNLRDMVEEMGLGDAEMIRADVYEGSKLVHYMIVDGETGKESLRKTKIIEIGSEAGYVGNYKIQFSEVGSNVSTVYYDANGGINAPEPQTKIKGEDLIITDNVPYLKDYMICGWTLEQHAPYENYNDAPRADYRWGDTYTKDEDMTLYALWVRGGVTIVYDANGGTFDWGTLADQMYPKGLPADIYVYPNEREGYMFLGWSTDKDASKPEYRVGDYYYGEEDLYLYAVWREKGEYEPGDVNDDGKVDSRDAIRLSKYLAKEDVEINLANADVTGDGKVNVQDLIRLKKYLAKVSVELV